MQRRTYITGVAMATVAAAVVATLAGAGSATTTAGGGTRSSHGVMAEGVDHLPSTTAADWVTYADHVIAVTATAEKIAPPAQSEIERGEGFLGRTVTLRVDSVLWSRGEAPRPAPQIFDYPAVGAVFTEGATDSPTPMALRNRPRLQTGHHYILAIEWEPAHCTDGDTPEPAQWRGLGEGSELPYDDNTIGQGESEGAIQTADHARALAVQAGPAGGLKEQLAGTTADTLVSALKAAAPAQRRQSSPQSAADCP
ncbi:hypothetical protein [Nonomuraea sp. NPDC050783]|uniref:hypothetical protein n=1 Tax=Nonomuraea sp. NPDC050783 TaxID=3154634 RepID=UPI003466E35C